MLKIVLRGISGIGKSTICRMLVDFFKSKGVMASVLSKDEIRQEIAKNLQLTYDYSEKQEIMTSYLYQIRLSAIENMTLSDLVEPLVVICDNTHVNTHQLNESGILVDSDIKKTVILEIGSPDSTSVKEEQTGKNIVDRQRTQMRESTDELYNWCRANLVPIININARSAIETGLNVVCGTLMAMLENQNI